MNIATAFSSPFSAFSLLWPTRAESAPVAPRALKVENAVFTHALVALAAKLAAVDGAPNAAEFAVFQNLFIGENEREAPKLKSMFVRQVDDQSPALQYARQVMNATYGQPNLHRELIDRLLSLATADAKLNAAEFEMLRAIAAVFRITGDAFKILVARHAVPTGSPYEVLGISSQASDEELRAHYMAQVQKLHPDRYQAAGATAETIAMLSDQLAEVNAAYESVRRQRAKKSPRLRSSARGARNTKGAKAD